MQPETIIKHNQNGHIKVYDMGTDWKCIITGDNVIIDEIWSSCWTADKPASLQNAVNRCLEINNLVVVETIK